MAGGAEVKNAEVAVSQGADAAIVGTAMAHVGGHGGDGAVFLLGGAAYIGDPANRRYRT